jgi:hypothetical protein
MGGTATRWYTTRSAVKAAPGFAGVDLDSIIDRYIAGATQHTENILNGRRFIPETATKYYPWPSRNGRGGHVLKFPDDDLIAVTLLQTRAQDTTPTTIAATDYFLEPVNSGPPYNRIEIDLSSSASFEPGNTQQRAISVAGRWAYCEDTVAAGALAEADDGSETALDVTDSSLIDVGHTILIGTEAMFVSAKGLLDTTANTNALLAADKSGTTVALAAGHGVKVKVGEVITIDSERMLVESISTDTLAVRRAYDGSTLATHANPSDVYAPRTLTVVRAVNGTTAAAHADVAAIVKYAPPADIVDFCTAHAIAHHQQEKSGWTGAIGGPDGGTIETKMFGLWSMEQSIRQKYGRVSI